MWKLFDFYKTHMFVVEYDTAEDRHLHAFSYSFRHEASEHSQQDCMFHRIVKDSMFDEVDYEDEEERKWVHQTGGGKVKIFNKSSRNFELLLYMISY